MTAKSQLRQTLNARKQLSSKLKAVIYYRWLDFDIGRELQPIWFMFTQEHQELAGHMVRKLKM